MKRFLKAICFFCVVALPLVAFAAVYDMSRTGIIAGMQRETKLWLSLPGANAANAATVNENIRTIKQGGTVTLTNQTLNLSTASGAYFLTRSSVDLRPYALIPGAQISVAATGTPGTTAVFTGLSAGTGETLGAELVTNGTFDIDTGWVKDAGWSISGGAAVAVGTTASIYQAKANGFGGELYRIDWDLLTRTAGAFFVRLSGTSNSDTPSQTVPASYIQYSTHTVAMTSLGIRGSGVTSGTADNFTVKQVLTPDATGASASSLTNGGINPNSASYVVTITRP